MGNLTWLHGTAKTTRHWMLREVAKSSTNLNLLLWYLGVDCSPNYSKATRFDLGLTAQVSTHFLSKQARKTVAARHVSGNSHGPTGFTATITLKAPNTKNRNKDFQAKKIRFSIRFAL